MKKHRTIGSILLSLLIGYLIIAGITAVFLFFWIGLHPSGPACEFFCHEGFDMVDLIASLVMGLFWPLFVPILLVSFAGGV